MSAKNGLTQPVRLLGCLMVVALLASALLASSASAMHARTPTAYLALGDSLSFGYKNQTFVTNEKTHEANCTAAAVAAGKGETALAAEEAAKCEPPSSFERGFVGDFGAKLAGAERKAGNALTVVNLGCPGETSDGLIGHTYGGAGSEYNPCGYHNTDGFPLKTEFGSASELEAALEAITTKAYGEVKAISLQIGSNDELAVVGKCETPSYDVEHGFASLNACIEHEAGPEGYAFHNGLFAHILENIGYTIGVMRYAGYSGPILVIGFYNPYALELQGSDALDKILNEHLEYEVATDGYGMGVKLAQPFPVINPEAALYTGGESSTEKEHKETKEGRAICHYTEMCNRVTGSDIHPTMAGYTAIGKLMWEAF